MHVYHHGICVCLDVVRRVSCVALQLISIFRYQLLYPSKQLKLQYVDATSKKGVSLICKLKSCILVNFAHQVKSEYQLPGKKGGKFWSYKSS